MLLVAASGGVEAVSFHGLSHVFAGVMTSDLALLGIAAGLGEPFDVTAACLALVKGAQSAAMVAAGKAAAPTTYLTGTLAA